MSATPIEAERRIHLSPENDIRMCGRLKDHLTECLSDKSPLIIDVGAFQYGDITFVQTLISAAKTAESWGVRMEITSPPPAFAELLERCGLGAQFHTRLPLSCPREHNEDLP